MINNTLANLSELVEKWEYIHQYCYDKTVGNGFYDFDLTKKNWQTAYAWQEVVSSFIEPSTPKEELDANLEYYCEAVLNFAKVIYQHKLDSLLMVEVLFYESLELPVREVEFLNIAYSHWFGKNDFEIFKEVPIPIIYNNKLLQTKKRQQRWNFMNKAVVDRVRDNFEAHKGEGEPVYILCVDKRDATNQTTKYLITFRDAYKTGIRKLSGKIILSKKASEVLYDCN